MGDYRKLKVWERSHRLTLDVYRVTASFPREELYGLTSQLRRAASSIPANIAEGCGRDGDAELARFLEIARGSASELDYHLLLASDLGLLTSSDHQHLAHEAQGVSKMLTTFLQALRPTRRPTGNSPQPMANSHQPIANNR